MGDKLFSILVHLSVLVIALVFFAIVGDVAIKGFTAIQWDFIFTEPSRSGREGGVGPILVSTFLLLGICLSIVISLGLGTAIYLNEFTFHKSKFSKIIELSLDILAGVPSIVFGLFGNVLFCKILGLGFSILSGGLTLACMALPLFIRTAQSSLRGIPSEYRSGSKALGFSKATTLIKVTLPVAIPGIIAGLILSIGRAMAETAALIFTSGYVDRMPSSLLDSGRALSVHIYDLSMNISGGDLNAYRSAFLLIIGLLFINFSASTIIKKTLRVEN
ncbi:MAG: phosphate ABC transporter, permease protein PstA [Bdellovibrionaceae bacterium]|nr:phosphate ABC transporter, permease protein PstA [Pseudobdellovibrionaceae bacterium]|tara:strand:+ start:268 stop:1092 length:825 start_codon:yes stop_codon:yes gene_type:complete